MKKRFLVFSVFLAGSAWLAFFGDKNPTSDTLSVDHLEKNTTSNNKKEKKIKKPYDRNDNTLEEIVFPIKYYLLNADKKSNKEKNLNTEKNLNADKKNSLFESQSWVLHIPPIQPPLQPIVIKSEAPPPPIAPPLPFTYLGKKFEDGVYEVYLSQGTGETIIIKEKSVINGQYRVDSINPPTLLLTYLPLNQVQILPIGGGD